MFTENVVIKKCVKTIDVIEEGKFTLLLNRIAQFLTSGASGKPFTAAEEEKLEASLEVTKEEIECLIEGIIKMFELCAYHVIKPGVLREQLDEGLSMSPRKAEIFAQAWTSSARGIIDGYKQKPFLPQLDHLSYSLSVEGASNCWTKGRLTKAQLQLGLVSHDNAKELNLEFTGDQLHAFFKKMEQIQGQLDAFR